jgi:signal transduction histidine kinase
MLVKAMRGTLTLENRREGGACATLRLPVGRPLLTRDAATQGVLA